MLFAKAIRSINKNESVSEGVVPWCKIYDSTILATNQGSVRRGAASVNLSINHPDIEEFLGIRRPKGDVNRQCLNLHQCVVIDDVLFEINMGSKNLRREAAKTGAIAGMEFEMIVPNVEGGDEDAEPEPDWDYDESVNSISDAVDFFDDAGQNSRRDLERLRERMQESYHQWLSDQFQSQWERDDSEFVFNYIKTGQLGLPL